MNTWNRRNGESKEAYAAFEEYIKLDADERGLRLVAQKLGKSSALIMRWSSRNEWVSRAAAYDAHMAAIRQREREKHAAKWEARREKLREEQLERELRHAERMEARGLSALDTLPPTRKVAKGEDGKMTIIMPASSAEYRAANDLLKTAREFMRGVLEMPLGVTRQELTGKDGGAVKVQNGIAPEVRAALDKIYGGGGE